MKGKDGIVRCYGRSQKKAYKKLRKWCAKKGREIISWATYFDSDDTGKHKVFALTEKIRTA